MGKNPDSGLCTVSQVFSKEKSHKVINKLEGVSLDSAVETPGR